LLEELMFLVSLKYTVKMMEGNGRKLIVAQEIVMEWLTHQEQKKVQNGYKSISLINNDCIFQNYIITFACGHLYGVIIVSVECTPTAPWIGVSTYWER